jgi:hypothetical protein
VIRFARVSRLARSDVTTAPHAKWAAIMVVPWMFAYSSNLIIHCELQNTAYIRKTDNMGISSARTLVQLHIIISVQSRWCFVSVRHGALFVTRRRLGDRLIMKRNNVKFLRLSVSR